MRVLVADDDPISRTVLSRQLAGWGFTPVLAEDGEAALRALTAGDGPRLAILDWVMPGLDGVEVIRRLRRTQHDDYTYVVLLTSRDDKREIAEGLMAGSDDYLSKPCDAHELQARLHVGRRTLELHAELRHAYACMREQAMHDPLTRLYSRGAILDLLQGAVEQSLRESVDLALILMDLDRFKDVNDLRGHQAGDAVLQHAADRARRCLRPYDQIGRYGGEEFLVVLLRCSAREAFAVAERVRRALETSPALWDGAAIPITASFGIAARGKPQRCADVLIREADLALYDAKHAGRNCVRIYERAHAAP